MRKLTTILLTLGAMGASALPATAAHQHFVYVEATGTCQYVGHGQTSIDDPDHGGYHRFHDQVHMGAPGQDGRGSAVDKQDNQGLYDCTARGAR
jgi:hypothetical protein